MCGQHPGRMPRVGVGGVILMSLVFYMFHSIMNIFVFPPYFWLEKLNYFHTMPGLTSQNKTKMIIMNDEIKATIPNNMESKIIEIDPVSEDTKKNVSLHKPCSRLAAQVLAT